MQHSTGRTEWAQCTRSCTFVHTHTHHTPTSLGPRESISWNPLIRHISDDSSTKHNCSTFKNSGWDPSPTLANSVYKTGTHFLAQHPFPLSYLPISEKFFIQWISIEFNGTAAVLSTCISNAGKPECAIAPLPVLLFPNKRLWCQWFLLPAEGQQFSLQSISKERRL